MAAKYKRQSLRLILKIKQLYQKQFISTINKKSRVCYIIQQIHTLLDFAKHKLAPSISIRSLSRVVETARYTNSDYNYKF